MLAFEERDSFRVYGSVISCQHVLEPATPRPGRYIPIVPVIGEEVSIGRRVVRHGVIRNLEQNFQRAYNYFRSAEAEAVALQPKAPWLLTEKNVDGYEDQWLTANTKNYSYLVYKPDTANGNQAPKRVSPGVNTAGIVEGLQTQLSGDERGHRHYRDTALRPEVERDLRQGHNGTAEGSPM